MQPDDRDAAFLWDMSQACHLIARFIDGQTVDELRDDDLLRSAIHWQVIVLGEAAHRISRIFREQHRDIDWVLLMRQRNFYAHEYDETDPVDLWVFVTTELPATARALIELTARFDAGEDYSSDPGRR